MSETLYPERSRCRTCRKKFGTAVLDGMFCSYSCAKKPTPSKNVKDAPRHCKREVNGKWDWKRKYLCEQHVPEKLLADPATNVYRCDYCRYLHVGHSRILPTQEEKLRRLVDGPETLGSVIQRVREQKNIDKKTLAKILKCPAIRITEIERGDHNIDARVLFGLTRALSLKIEVIATS
jgi:Helix-turn-helix